MIASVYTQYTSGLLEAVGRQVPISVDSSFLQRSAVCLVHTLEMFFHFSANRSGCPLVLSGNIGHRLGLFLSRLFCHLLQLHFIDVTTSAKLL